MGERLNESQVDGILKKAKLKKLEPFTIQNNKLKCMCLVCLNTVYPRLSSILKGQGGCKFCGVKKISKKNLTSSQEFTRILKKHNLKALEKFTNAKTKWKCKCLVCHQIVYPTLNQIKSKGSGCRYCGIKKRSNARKIKQNDAIKVMKNAGLEPQEPYKGALAKWKCICTSCNNLVYPKYNQIKNGQSGCFKCGHARGGQKNKLTDEIAVKIMNSYNLSPIEPYVNSTTKWTSICLICRRKVAPRLGGVLSNRGGCGYCARNKLDIKDIELIMKNAKLEPLVEYPGAHKPWKSKCLVCQRIVNPILVSIKNGKSSGCSFCSKTRVHPDEAYLHMLNMKLKPLVKYPGAHKPWKCICLKCKMQVSPNWGSIRNGQGGCKFCADLGIDYKAPTYLYLMFNSGFDSIKIGISNTKSRQNRIKVHKSYGWELYKKIEFTNGVIAESIESDVLKYFRFELGLPPHLVAKQMPQGGHSETLDASEIDLPTIWAKVEELSKIEKRTKNK